MTHDSDFWSSSEIPEGHGCTGTEDNFRSTLFDQTSEAFCRKRNLSALLVPDQQHTANAMVIKTAYDFELALRSSNYGTQPVPGPADAIILYRSVVTSSLAIGVRTADCVPLIFWSELAVAAVHAGWRGLAQGIIGHVLVQMPGRVRYVLIGPCAGASQYEVEIEVLNALGPSAVFRPAPERAGKYLLDLALTARAQLASIEGPAVTMAAANRCTISDRLLHSYRRQGPNNFGLNLTYARLKSFRS